ncbi:hypothetical protein TNIN_403661 [Trichonephila inaurata madagascariensis]|uniref:Uncharacterized protein n=1 Tax=Trichonephila inaurata madagascariensis TaxID=2747483 RepID=A0A8X6XZ66_9ARAC|nr:hypothetical protein TNIN_403661 [Trichonephila inaurata madagascariensis]
MGFWQPCFDGFLPAVFETSVSNTTWLAMEICVWTSLFWNAGEIGFWQPCFDGFLPAQKVKPHKARYFWIYIIFIAQKN